MIIPYPLNWLYDAFQWLYWEQHILREFDDIKTVRYDITSRSFKTKKFGEFSLPMKGQYVRKKNKLIAYYHDDNKEALAYAKIYIANTDAAGTLQIQEFTTDKPLTEIPEAVSKKIVDDFKDTGKGAIPLLECKTNPLLYKSMMADKRLKELTDISSDIGDWLKDNMLIVIIAVVGGIVLLYWLSNGGHIW